MPFSLLMKNLLSHMTFSRLPIGVLLVTTTWEGRLLGLNRFCCVVTVVDNSYIGRIYTRPTSFWVEAGEVGQLLINVTLS